MAVTTAPDAPEVTLTKGERTRRALLAAAIERFGRDGYRGTSVADIARDAGVGGTAAYAYFPNKEALFLAALDDDATRVIATAVTGSADLAAFEWGTAVILRLVAELDRHPLARRVLAGLEPDVTDRINHIPAMEELRRETAEQLRDGQRDGTVRADVDPDVFARGIVAITVSLLMAVVQLGPSGAVDFGSDIQAVLDAALAPRA